MALTDAKCRAAQPGAKLQKVTDGGGLQLWVQPSGARLWRRLIDLAIQKLLALGQDDCWRTAATRHWRRSTESLSTPMPSRSARLLTSI